MQLVCTFNQFAPRIVGFGQPVWAVYGCIVGGYALGKRGLAIIPQLAQIRQRREQNVDATDE
ncbi:MAG: hypothetical protein ACFNQI_05470 [Eikenella corrodens]